MTEEYIQGNVKWSDSAPFIKTEDDIELIIKECLLRFKNLDLIKYFTLEFDEK
jgi:hypothetical protein